MQVARDEARIFTAIWQDDHFLSLSPDEQRLYLFLLSQPDLSYCGVIALRERRWSKKARGLTVEQISKALAALAANPSGNPSPNPSGSPVSGPLVVVDEDAEEVFVRSLIRLDGIWKQPNLLKAAREAARLIQSPQIRRALVAELRRIPVEKSDSAQVKKVMAEFIAEFAEASGDPSEDAREETANPSSNPSGNPSADPSQGKGEGYGEYVEDSPIPGIPDPVPPSAGADAPQPKPKPKSSRRKGGPKADRTIQDDQADELTNAYWERYSTAQGWIAIRQVVRTALAKIPRDDVARALDLIGKEGGAISGGSIQTALKQINAARNSQAEGRPRLVVARSTTDERVAQAQALKAKFASQTPPTIAGEIAP